jgi:PKD repeat protein
MVVVAGDRPDGLRNGGFAATPGVFDNSYGGNGDAVVMRLTGDLGTLDFASYLGGSGAETVTGLALAPDGDIIVGGSIYIAKSILQQPGFKPDFPLTSCAFDRNHTYSSSRNNGGEFEGFFTRISPDGTTLHYSTLLGGDYDDYKINVGVRNTRDQEVVISTTTHSPGFITTAGAYQRTKNNGTQDQPVMLVLKPVVSPVFRADTLGCGAVVFTDSSFGDCIWRDGPWKPTSWLWDFGDGTTSTDQFPTHEYTKLGSYKVKLIIGDPIDSTTRTVVVKSIRTDVELNAHIDRTHSANLGDDVAIPLILDDDPDSLQATSITITIHHDTTMLGTLPVEDIDVGRMIDETQLEGWDATVSSPRAGTIIFHATAPEGEVLHGPGTLLWVDFRTFLRADITTISDSIWNSELPFELAVDGNFCTNVILKPGHLTLRSCALQYRLIKRSDFAIKLNAAQPNPFNPATEITFSLAFDGPARLEIFNESGERVSLPVDGEMKAGEYTLTWNAAAFPSGVYYYRLTSGTWSQTRSMVLVK